MSQIATPPRPSASPRKVNRRNTRRVLNTPLLLGSIAVVALGGGIALGVHHYFSSQIATTFLQRATVLEQEEDWSAASVYFARYLQMEPADLEVRLRLLNAVEESATNEVGQRRLVSMLYQLTGSLPERIDLRQKLVEQLIAARRFKAAAESAAELLELGDDSQKRIARRAMAIAKYADALEGRDVTIAEAAEAFQEVLQGDPGDIEIASLTANLYRQQPEAVGPEGSAEEADAIMNRLVSARPTDPDALLARNRYRQIYQLDGARDDIDAALKIAPERIDVLLNAADSDLRSSDVSVRERAKLNLEKVIVLAPLDSRGYYGLAKFHLANGESDEAIRVLLDGRDRISEKQVAYEYLLANCLIDSGKIDRAAAIAAEFDRLTQKQIALLPTAGRIQLENMNRSLEAKLAIQRKDFPRAIRACEAILVAGGKVGDVSESIELLEAYALLAAVMSQSQRPDQAAAYWEALADRAPMHRDAGLKAGLACLALGRAEEGIFQLERYLKLPNASPEAYVSLIQARMQEQLLRPATLRDWSAFQQSVKLAESKLPNRWEIRMARVAYLASLGTQESRTEALQLLRELESTHGDNPVVAERLVVSYQQLGEPSDVKRALNKLRQMPGSEFRAVVLQAGMLASSSRGDEAADLLQKSLNDAAPQQRRELELARVRLLAATGKLAPAKESVASLIEANPQDAAMLILGIEVALLGNDYETAEKWEESLKSASTIDDFDWKYFRAKRMIGQFDELSPSQRVELEQLVSSVRTQRPAWTPGMILNGQLAERRGDRAGAIEAYRTALAAGDRRTETLQLITKALYAAGRYDDAKRVLTQFSSSAAAIGQHETMAIASAVQSNRLSEARALAQRAVDENTNDPLHYVLLANLEFEAGDREAAERTFRTALERFPRDQRVWNGVFLFFVQTRQLDKARIALDRWASRVPLSQKDKELVLGDGKLLLGERDAAESHFRKCIQLDGNYVPARMRMARLLMESDANAAREHLDVVLRTDPSQAEARQFLAAILAATGSDSDWTQAVQLLERSASDGNGLAAGVNDRLHAILLARKGKNQAERKANYKKAQLILEQRLKQQGAKSPTFDVDRMLLAGIHEQLANLPGEDKPAQIRSARDALRPLADRSKPTAEHLLAYIQFLLRHIADPSAVSSVSISDDYRAELASDASDRIDALETLLKDGLGSDKETLPTALRVKLLSLQGKDEEGKELIEAYAGRELESVESDSERAKIYFRVGSLYQAANFDEEAEDWFRKLVEITPSGYVLVAQSLLKQGKSTEAVDFCIQAGQKLPPSAVATVLAQILSSDKVDPAVDRKAQPLIAAALDEDRGNVDLLMSAAVQRVTRDDLDEAVKLFKRVIELQPRHTLALNNLATIYAEQPAHLSEAQDYVERAMAVAGRNPALLDTLGTILLRAGKFGEAVSALEESVAGSASDPRYYFHLAAAYEGAGQPEKAKAALSTATQMGLDRAILTEGDRTLLSTLKQQLLAASNQN